MSKAEDDKCCVCAINSMAQYIDKSALVAEIEKCYNECLKRAKITDSDYYNAKADAYRNVLVILSDTLEVKEVNLEKEFTNYTKDILACDVQFEPFTHLYNCAKHFFEHGLKAQKEPVSIWHDASEEPDDKSSCLIHYIVGGEVSYRDIVPVLYNKKVKEFISESYPHPTGYKVEQKSLEGGCVAEMYKNIRDRFPLSDIYKWAYINDILKLSNVEKTVKDWKEPVSIDLEKAAKDYSWAINKQVEIIKKEITTDAEITEIDIKNAYIAGADWQRRKMMGIDSYIEGPKGGYTTTTK